MVPANSRLKTTAGLLGFFESSASRCRCRVTFPGVTDIAGRHLFIVGSDDFFLELIRCDGLLNSAISGRTVGERAAGNARAQEPARPLLVDERAR